MGDVATEDVFRIGFERDDGTLRHRGRDGWREPICPECGEGIRYVLDMASWKQDDRGGFVLCHARCLWTREGFITEAERAHPDPE